MGPAKALEMMLVIRLVVTLVVGGEILKISILRKQDKDNPKYIKGEELNEPKATGAPVKTISSTENGVTAILRAKHQDLFN